YAFKLPDAYGDAEAAPLLCAGLIGYRSYRMAGDPRRLGIYGFGAAAHIIAQVAVHEGREVYAFTSPGDADAQRFARGLGACWARPCSCRRRDGPPEGGHEVRESEARRLQPSESHDASGTTGVRAAPGARNTLHTSRAPSGGYRRRGRAALGRH